MARDDELAQRAARVVADERDVAQVELLEQVGDQLGQPGGAEVGVGRHRRAMRAEREVGHDAAQAVEAIDDRVPQPPVDQHAVHEHDRRPLADVAVVDHATSTRPRPPAFAR